MPDTDTFNLIKEKLKAIEVHGYGEVTIKVRNGLVYRILQTEDTVIEPDSNGSLDRKGN